MVSRQLLVCFRGASRTRVSIASTLRMFSSTRSSLLAAPADPPFQVTLDWVPIKSDLLPNAGRPPTAVLTSLRSFPSLEPVSFTHYPSDLFFRRIRSDILWRAVVYENDALRKRIGVFVRNRAEMGFSKKKMAPQKGRGKARMGKAGSPIFHNGGKPFGPRHPDSSTQILRRLYNIALRTAFSYAYQRGTIYVIDGAINLPVSHARASSFVFGELGLLGKKVYCITAEPREEISESLRAANSRSKVVLAKDIDVRMILQANYIIIEKEALDFIAEKTLGKEYLNPERKVSQIRRKSQRVRLHARRLTK
ncbi:mitochondrial 54S ribosomal protein uL4m [Lipomyces oligophaga]|uniref:mitochondrial 54S ribosomal protein uL4m n=1 Tax=Lipomyces oligophaga TaxID=45792 RepID=UPI0034CF68AD